MTLVTIFFGAQVILHILLMIATIKDMVPDKDEIEFNRKLLETMKKVIK